MINPEKDYYKILGVSKDATDKQVRTAFRTHAKRLHPDKNPGNPEAESRFKEMNEAYEILGDVKKRREYDQLRELTSRGFRFQPGGRAGDESFDFSQFMNNLNVGGREEAGGFGDIFGRFFGRGAGVDRDHRTRAGPGRGQDIRTEAELPVSLAIRGGSLGLTVTGRAPCARCLGSGQGAQTPCPHCKGTGRSSGIRGGQPCVRCGGLGTVPASTCTECGGRGEVESSRKLSLKVPPSSKDATEMRLAGQGGPAPQGGAPGDLFVRLRVVSDTAYRFEDGNVVSSVRVSVFEAILGTSREVSTATGENLKVKIPPGTQPGTRLRLRGKGLAGGDQFVEVGVTIPKDLSAEQRSRVEELAKALEGVP